MRRLYVLALIGLTACNDFVPVEKTATMNATTGELALPHPCPDWSQNATINYDNSNHSNYGCAVNGNLAVQLEDPWDLLGARPSQGNPSDTETSVRTLERYRAGEIPVPLVPQQDSAEGN
jgi:type IV pilus biogenesis protein CpaD/CtpE